MVIGRDAGSDFVIDDRAVSRNHVGVQVVLLVRDLKSANGVFHRGRRVEGQTQVSIGDEITLGASGRIRLVLEENGGSPPPSIEDDDPEGTIRDAGPKVRERSVPSRAAAPDSREVEQLRSEVERLRERCRQSELREENSVRNLHDVEARAAQLEREFRDSLQAERKRVRDLTSENESLRSSEAGAEEWRERARGAEDRAQRAEATERASKEQAERLSKRVREMGDELAQARREVTQAEGKIAESTAELAKLREQEVDPRELEALREGQKENGLLKGRIEDLRKVLAQHDEELEQLREQARVSVQLNEELRDARTSLESARGLEEKLDKTQQVLDQRERELNELRDQLSTALGAAERQAIEARAVAKRAEASVSKARQQQEEVAAHEQSEVQRLNAALGRSNAEVERLSSELERARSRVRTRPEPAAVDGSVRRPVTSDAHRWLQVSLGRKSVEHLPLHSEFNEDNARIAFKMLLDLVRKIENTTSLQAHEVEGLPVPDSTEKSTIAVPHHSASLRRLVTQYFQDPSLEKRKVLEEYLLTLGRWVGAIVGSVRDGATHWAASFLDDISPRKMQSDCKGKWRWNEWHYVWSKWIEKFERIEDPNVLAEDIDRAVNLEVRRVLDLGRDPPSGDTVVMD